MRGFRRLLISAAWLMIGSAPSAVWAADDVREIFSVQELRDLWLPSEISGLGIAPAPPAFVLEPAGEAFSGVYGADVSHHNTDCAGPNCKRCEIDWSKMNDHGVKFVYMKATTGVGAVKPDVSFPIYWKALANFHAKGQIYRGSYHWLTSDPGHDGLKQAKHFLSVVNPKDAQLAPVVDFEEDPVSRDRDYYEAHPQTCRVKKSSAGDVYYVCDGWVDVSKSERLQRLKDWLETVAKATSMVPVIYTRTGYWRDMLGADGESLIKQYSAWLAQYPVEPRKWHDAHPANGWRMPNLPKDAAYPPGKTGDKYPSRHFWQFTERGRFKTPVITCNGTPADKRSMDMNWYPSSEADFKQAFGLAQPASTKK
ncbi:GH25 family lysozyme M1 (1,4-beta-N-acetylmuramidase) [Bradyrhizobium sp. CIR18]|uniref:glycoside hydrolase family 25 protein n=1 Tax=Bradyrhizobium sp. CIR18 TaxID=2663839 RepID=UPI001605E9BB|nr:GH25 family lysozyme [Bradyrhizobium sp. CIR18]MBB4363181.1 GH25 family lysozyme M1 (1,4-beta-N-acetylmuramidase) [Bradyrhizobium sp. CIR18]